MRLCQSGAERVSSLEEAGRRPKRCTINLCQRLSSGRGLGRVTLASEVCGQFWFKVLPTREDVGTEDNGSAV